MQICFFNCLVPDNRAWKVCTQHSTAAWRQHVRYILSLLRSSSSCSATGRSGVLPTFPFPAPPPPPPPGLLRGALSGDKIKPYIFAITSLFNFAFLTVAQMLIHARPSAILFSGNLLIELIVNLKQLCDLNIKNIACIILTVDFSIINGLAAKLGLIYPQ